MIKWNSGLYALILLALPLMTSAQETIPLPVERTQYQPPISSVSAFPGAAQDFIGKVQAKIGDWETPFMGLYPTSFLGLWESRTTGKMYNLQTYSAKGSKNPWVLVLAEVKWNNPNDHGYGYHNVVFSDAVDVEYKGKQKIHMDIGSCVPELGNAPLWSPRYSIVTMMRTIDAKHPKNTHEKYLADEGFDKGFAEEGWFVDAENGKLIPMTQNELSLLICRERWDQGE